MSTTGPYTLSLHDALPISQRRGGDAEPGEGEVGVHRLDLADQWRDQAREATGGDDVRRDRVGAPRPHPQDRKSTRLNSSHQIISYAVFCLKKKIHANCLPQ